MLYLRRTRFFRSILLPLMLVAFLSGCHKWVEVEPPVHMTPEAGRLEHVRLTMSDGRMFELQRAVVREDTVFGSGSLGSVAIPMDQIRTVEVRKAEIGNTIGLALLGLVLVPIAFIVLFCEENQGSGFGPSC